MGLLTILKKMKQKERELRLLMLYPRAAAGGSRGWGSPSERPMSGAPYWARPATPTAPQASLTWAPPMGWTLPGPSLVG